MNEIYDVVIVGGGPGGLAAALTLGRARRRVLLCDRGARRNAMASHVQNFVTRDGTPPEEFREVGREQLLKYPKVEVQDWGVLGISGERGDFRVELAVGAERVAQVQGTALADGESNCDERVVSDELVVRAKRIVLATGMVDELLPLDGFAELWGRSIFQCPFCHGWEERDKKWGVLALPESLGHFPEMMTNWTQEVTVFTQGEVEIPEELAQRFAEKKIQMVSGRIRRLLPGTGEQRQKLVAVELEGGEQVPCEVLFAHPPQRQVQLVNSLQLELSELGYVNVDPMTRQTSVPGIYAVGDLTSRMQAAVMAAATGMQAGAVIAGDLSH